MQSPCLDAPSGCFGEATGIARDDPDRLLAFEEMLEHLVPDKARGGGNDDHGWSP